MVSSLEEEAVGAIDLLDQIGQAGGAEHHVLREHGNGRVLVSGARGLAGYEAGVDVVDSDVVTLVGPALVVLGKDA